MGTELRVLAARGDVEAAWSLAREQADALLRTSLLLAQRHPEAALEELECGS